MVHIFQVITYEYMEFAGGQRKPTQFMCLVLKMLQIQPEKEIIKEFIENDDYKWVNVGLVDI